MWLLLAPLMGSIYCPGLSDSQNTSRLPLFPLWLQLLASVCPYAASFPATTSPTIVWLLSTLQPTVQTPGPHSSPPPPRHPMAVYVSPASQWRETPAPHTGQCSSVMTLLSLAHTLSWAITRLRKLFAVTSQTGRQVGCAEIRCLYS